MSFKKRLVEVTEKRQEILNVISGLDKNETLNDHPSLCKYVVENLPPELCYQLALSSLFGDTETDPLFFHYLNPFTKFTPLDLIKRGIDIFVNYDYYGDLDMSLAEFVKTMDNENKSKFYSVLKYLGEENDKAMSTFKEKLLDDSINSTKKLLLQFDDIPKYKYHFLKKIADLIPDLVHKDELLRYHEFNIFDDSTKYDIVKEWLEIMKHIYYFTDKDLSKGKLYGLLEKLNQEEVQKVKLSFEEFEINTTLAEEFQISVNI